MEKKKNKHLLPFLFIILIVFIFYSKFFIKGLIPIPADIIAGMYYPWVDYRWDYPTGVPVKNPILTDSVSQFWIWRNLAIESLKQGKILLWNSYSACGSPLVPLFHSALFSPFNIFYFLFNQTSAMTLIVISQTLLTLVFTYLFLLSLRLTRTASILGAMTFAFSSFMIVWLSWGTTSAVALGLPILLWGFEKFKTTGKMKFFVFQILGLSFSLHNAHLQTFFYVCLFWIFYIGFSILTIKASQKRKRLLIASILVFIFFIFLNAFAIFPALEVLRYSIRGVEDYLSWKNYAFLPISQLIKFWAPDFFGSHATYNYWGPLNYQEFPVYFGLIPFILALIAITKSRKKQIIKFFFISCLVFMGLAFKYPLGWIIYRFHLPFLSAAPASRVLFLVNFSAAVLAAFGLDEFRKLKDYSLLKKILLISWVPILGIGIGVLFSFLKLKNFPNYNYYENLNLWITNLKVSLRNLILPILLLIITSIIFFWKSRTKKLERFLLFCLLSLTMAELLRFGWKYTPFVPTKLFFPSTPVIEYLKNEKSIFRIERERGPLLPPNMWIPFKLESASTYDPVVPLNYVRFLEKITGRKPTRYVELEKNDFELFNLLNIKYFLALKYKNNGGISPEGEILSQLKKEFTPVFDDGSVVVLENKQVFPRGFLLNKDFFDVNQDKITLNKIKAARIDSQVKFTAYSIDGFNVEVNTPEEAILVVSNTYFPGWKAYAGNRRLEIKKTSLPFLSLKISKGENTILFKYQPDSFKIGIIISIVSLLFLLFYLLSPKWRFIPKFQRGVSHG